MACQYINGVRRTGTSSDTMPLTDPSTGKPIAKLDLAAPAHVDLAVSAARGAFPQWSRATPGERSNAVGALARLLGARAENLAAAESREAGKPIRPATQFDVPGTVDNTAFFAGAARNLEGRASSDYSADHTSSTRR